MEDVDMMEVDEDYLDHSKAFRRLPVGQFISTKLNTEPQNSCIVIRKRIQAKRLTKKTCGRSINVLDSNILIEHLSDLKTFLSNTHLVESCSMIIPFTVIQELDNLKKKNKSLFSTFRFINEQLRAESERALTSDKAWLKKYPSETVKAAQTNVDIYKFNNDDRILESSLLIQEIANQSGDIVFLVTDDLNLRNKALATDLKAIDWDEFCHKFGIENTSKSKNGKTIERLRPATKKINVTNGSKHKIAQISSTISEERDSSSDPMQFGDWLTLKYSAEIKLRSILEKILRKVYDNLWDKMFDIDLANSSLFEIIRTLKKGWVGTFSDIFDRNKKVYETLENLFDLLRTEVDTKQLTTLTNQLLQLVYKIEKDID